MAKTHPHKVLERAEAAGIKIVIDASTWTDRIFPLVPAVSPERCELVAEARRIADMLDTRVDPPPDGVVYGVDTDTLINAFALATAYIDGALKKGIDNGKSNKDAAATDQPDVVDGDDDTDTQPGGDASGAGNGKGGRTKKRRVQDGNQAA